MVAKPLVRVYHNSMLKNLNYRLAVTGTLVHQYAEQAAQEMLDYARQNAPWQDRTGDARSELGVEVVEEGGQAIIELYHGVEYGYWLEVIQNGRFAIIMPTLELYAPRFFLGSGVIIE